MTSTTGTKRKRMWATFNHRGNIEEVRRTREAAWLVQMSDETLAAVTVIWKPKPKKARKT